MTAHFSDLLTKFSEKVCNEFEKLKMDHSKQPGSEAEEMGVSRKSAQPRRRRKYIDRTRRTLRQQADELSQSKESKFDTEKLPSQRNNITVKLSDDWWEKLQGLVGRENKLNEFCCAQKKSRSLAVAVTGVAGIGKTSLVGAVYKKMKRQFDCYAWVDMFGKSTSDAVRDMLTLFSKKQPVSCPPCYASTMDEGSLRKTLSTFLTEKKFLLVLDDITSEDDWTSFKTALPKNNCNGKVVMTSRKLDLSGCRNIKLEGLNVEDSCNLLFTEEETSKLSSSEKSVAEKVSNYVKPMLKSCFLYGALFPPRSKILCRKLIRLWIAEGFIDEKNDMTMEEAGELQLQELLGRNMFQMAKMGTDGKPKDLQTLAGVKLTEGIAEQLKELHQLQKLSVGKVKRNLITQLADSIENIESLPSLTIKCDLGEQIHAGLSGSLTKTLTLRVEGEVLDLYGWVKNLKGLTHLKLKDCVLTHDPFVELGNMINLVYLSVQNAYVGESIRFPKDCFPSMKKLSIAHFQALSQWYIDGGALKNLEKLIIEGCPKLTHLPRYFTELNNFRVTQVIKMPVAFGEEAKQLGEKIEKTFRRCSRFA